MVKKIWLYLFSVGCLVPGMGMAAKAKNDIAAIKMTPHAVAPVPISNYHYKDTDLIYKEFMAEKRSKSPSSRSIASEDLLSADFKQFRDEYIAARDGIQFEFVLKKWITRLDTDEAFKNSAENSDLKFVLARLRAFLPMKGIIWRMTPLVHNVLVSQEVLLATLRNFAEQIMINEPDSHVQAQMMYFTMPLPGVRSTMEKEADFTTFLLTEVLPELNKSIATLESLRMVRKTGGGEVGLVFDTKLRFGTNSFGGNDYQSYERYKAIGNAEKFATLARLHRRIAAIEMMAAYDWNGHFQLRQDVAAKFGMGVKKDALIEFGTDTAYISGMTRAQRAEIFKKDKYRNLYAMVKGRGDGSGHLKNAYEQMKLSAFYNVMTWNALEQEPNDRAWQIDPEVFGGRREQVAVGIENIKKIFYDQDFKDGRTPYGTPTELVSSLSGEKVFMDLKNFLTNPNVQPQDLKDLIAANHDLQHSELFKLRDLAKDKSTPDKSAYGTLKLENSGHADVLTMMTVVEGADGKLSRPLKKSFRDYLYGRGTQWNTSQYQGLFGRLDSGADVARKMGLLNETRGTKYVTMLLTPFIR